MTTHEPPSTLSGREDTGRPEESGKLRRGLLSMAMLFFYISDKRTCILESVLI